MTYTISKDIQLIVWDWNGTIYDDARICQDITNEQLQVLGLEPLSYETQEILFRHPVKEYYETMGVNFIEGQFEKLSEEFHVEYGKRRKHGGVRLDAVECLKRMAESNRKQIVLSAYKEADLKTLVAECELDSYFDVLLGLSDCHAVSKVERGVEWIKAQNMDAKNILIIGDTNHDYEVAKTLGAECVLTPSGYQHRNLLIQTGAPIIDSLQDLSLC